MDQAPIVDQAPTTSAPAGARVMATRARLRIWACRTSLALFVGYVVALAALVLSFRLIGESWWVTTAALYLPRIGFALPLPVLALALAITGPRRLLWLLPVPLSIILFPLMGLRLGTAELMRPARAASADAGVRILSYNVAFREPAPAIAKVIAAAKPDIIVLQECEWWHREPITAEFAKYQRNFTGEFTLLTHYPIKRVIAPRPLDVPGRPAKPAMFVQYEIETPLGLINVFNVHPFSPRAGLEEVRDQSLWQQVRKGRLARDEAIELLRKNATVRRLQIEALSRAARAVNGPVVIAGDTNLPGQSRILLENLADFRDGFEEVGRGFGYTYPAKRPWMRLDRMMVSEALEFASFEVLPRFGSDHLPIVATAIIAGQ